MTVYHETGTVCNAEKRACPLGISESAHIEADSIEDFEAKMEAKMKAEEEFFGPSLKPERSLTVDESRAEFSKNRGDFLLVNGEDGYILSDNCMVIEAENLEPEDYQDLSSLLEAVEKVGVPIQDLEGVGKIKDPLVVEVETGAISTSDHMYAVRISDQYMPENFYEDEFEAIVWAEERGFPLF